MSFYTPHYPTLLEKARVNTNDLPDDLRALVTNYDRAMNALQDTEAGTQKRLLFIAVQADAVIAAAVHGLYRDRLQETPVDKVKLLALKAKALRLKLDQYDNK